MDYAKEGRELLLRVNLQLDGAPERYSDVNPVFVHPPTNATLFVGNARASQSRETLASIDCTRIVFCQQPGEGKMAFSKDPAFKYLAYPIGLWRQKLSLSPKPAATLQYFEPLFRFVEGELAEGNNVMIHCLAGAHRAGTAGVACLMHLADLDRATATTIAQTARPAINPIGDFPRLLGALEAARKGAGPAATAAAGTGGAGAGGKAGGFGGFGGAAMGK